MGPGTCVKINLYYVDSEFRIFGVSEIQSFGDSEFRRFSKLWTFIDQNYVNYGLLFSQKPCKLGTYIQPKTIKFHAKHELWVGA